MCEKNTITFTKPFNKLQVITENDRASQLYNLKPNKTITFTGEEVHDELIQNPEPFIRSIGATRYAFMIHLCIESKLTDSINDLNLSIYNWS